MKTISLFVICFIVFSASLNRIHSQNYSGNIDLQGDSYGIESYNGILAGLGGLGNYAAIPHNTLLNPQVNGSMECWVYLNSYNESNSYIVQKGNFFIFGIGNTTLGHKPFLFVNGVTFLGIDSVPLNRWVHLGVSWFQSSPNSLVSFFRDGSPAGAQSSPVTWVNNTDSLTIGGSRISGMFGVNGFVDEVRLWNTTMGAADIARSRFVGIGDAPGSNVSGSLTSSEIYKFLIASWTFNVSGVVTENINNLTGRYRGNATVFASNLSGQPIPYNLALYLPGNSINNHIRVPSNSAFALFGGGTIESWVYCNPPMGYTVISKGSTLALTTFRLYIQGTGALSLQLGGNSVFGGFVQQQKWTHIAATWTGAGGSNYSVKFYINGKFVSESILTTSIPFNNDLVRIGNLQWDANNNFAGYIDDLRIYSRQLTHSEIIANMFNNVKSGTLLGPIVAAWDFEGNLNNNSSTAGINGTFNTGAVNNSRFSGYKNESIAGPISEFFEPHPTTLNRNQLQNPFPGGFSIKAPDRILNAGTTVYDTIYIPGNVTLSSFELFLSLQHPSVQGVIAKIKAPNGTERSLVSINGGTGNDILTFFNDGAPSLSSSNPPWSLVVNPYQQFSNFNGTSSQGNWVLSVQNTAGQPEGKLLGWGIRINNSVTSVEPVSGIIPEKFSLGQNYPNPFNPETRIRFNIPFNSKVKLSIYDITGTEVLKPINNELRAGEYEISVNLTGLSSGTYFYKLESESFTEVKKMVLIK